jgi:lipoprotein-releasing system permease protein
VFKAYLKYFFVFILRARNRQRLLILAVVGLFISAFALIVLQSTMGGLQNNLMERSKNILGRATYYYKGEVNDPAITKFTDKLDQQKIHYSKEYEIELLLRYQTFITPVIVHGIDQTGYMPPLVAEAIKLYGVGKKVDAIMPRDLAYKVGVAPPESLQIISPAHVDELMGEVPRSQTIQVEGVISTDVPEVDLYHIWVRLPLVQNLIRDRLVNRIRIYDKMNFSDLKKNLPPGAMLKTWEEENATLVWALNLESTIMVFLFAAMSLLVSFCISSGLLIFFNKIKNDLSSFWILGASLSQIDRSTRIFLHLMSFLSIIVGIVFGLIFLKLFDQFAPEIMPDVFVDRKIPILITTKGLAISFFVPFLISSIFIFFSLKQFQKDHNLLDHVRSIS